MKIALKRTLGWQICPTAENLWHPKNVAAGLALNHTVQGLSRTKKHRTQGAILCAPPVPGPGGRFLSGRGPDRHTKITTENLCYLIKH